MMPRGECALSSTRPLASSFGARDNVIAVTDARGNTTTFVYDALDRQVSRTNPNGDVWTFEYDARDLRIATVKPDGTRIAFAYDERRRLTSMGVDGNPLATRSFSYDADGNLIAAVSGAGTADEVAWSFTYDARDLLTQATQSLPNAGPSGATLTFTYEYDALGRRIAMRGGGGAVTTYLYDDADRLTGVTLPSGRTVTFDHDEAGRRTSVALPNGLTTAALFDIPAAAGTVMADGAAASGTTGRLLSLTHGVAWDGSGSGAPLPKAAGPAARHLRLRS